MRDSRPRSALRRKCEELLRPSLLLVCCIEKWLMMIPCMDRIYIQILDANIITKNVPRLYVGLKQNSSQEAVKFVCGRNCSKTETKGL